MANVINRSSGDRVYLDSYESPVSVSDMMANSQGQMSDELCDSVQYLATEAKGFLKQREPMIHWKTKNKSFRQLYNDLYRMGIKNNTFFLALYDSDLQAVDPYSPILPPDMQLKIILECMINPWYWLREVLRIPTDGMPIEIGGGVPYQIDRNNLAAWYLFLNGIDHYQSKPRQTGKTQDAVAKMNYAYHFGTMSSEIMFFNRTEEYAKKNLYRLKVQRDMLPPWMQMRSVYVENGKIDKGIDNIKMMRNPITGNTISVMSTATTKESAMKLGRGATSSLQYLDEFDFINYQNEIMNAASFAYATASANAKKNNALYGRVLTSTPGDLDTKSGTSAAIYIEGMIVWDDKYLDRDIEDLRREINSPKKNRFVYVEHTWQQLKLGMDWYERACGLVSNQEDTILREIELQRRHGGDDSPFERSHLQYIERHKKTPIDGIDVLNKFCPIQIYEKLQYHYPYILSIDPSDGLSRDNNAMTLINPFTQKPAAEFQANYISQTDLSKMIVAFLDKYCPKTMIVVESNRGQEVLNRLKETIYRYQLYYDDDKLAKTPVDRVDGRGNLIRQSIERRAMGFTTSPSSRPKLFALLEDIMQDRKELICTQYLVDDVCGLVRLRGTAGKIAAGDGKHDDNIMSYLIGLYIFYYAPAELLERFGIRRGMRPPEDWTDADGNLTPEAQMEQYREITPNLPDNLRGLFEDMLKQQKKNPVDEAWEYQKQVVQDQANMLTKLPSQMTPYERAMMENDQYTTSAAPLDESFWNAYDASVMESNEDEDRYRVNIADLVD